jgi:plasmid stabilization system protein ParE
MGKMVPEYDNPSIRELTISPYRLIYRVDSAGAAVLVIAVIHGSRQLPSLAEISDE